MGVDFVTLAAQVVNFLILVAILWFLLFKRVLKAMDERENRIASTLDDAEKRARETDEERKSLRKKHDELEENREKMMAKMRDEVESQRKKLEKRARNEVEEQQKKWESAMRSRQERTISELRRKAALEAVDLSSHILRDLANDDLQTRAVEQLLTRIGENAGKDVEDIRNVIRERNETCVVAAPRELRENERKKIEARLKEFADGAVSIQYDLDPELIMGLEIRVDGKRLTWAVPDYLDRVSEKIERALQESYSHQTGAKDRNQDNDRQDERKTKGKTETSGRKNGE